MSASFYRDLERRERYTGAVGIYTYRKYKAEILEDCRHRCVYCDGHCGCFGGAEMMELDHFRPKSQEFFPELRDDATNLVLACRSCNGKKKDDWPAGKDCSESHLGGLGYIDPFLVKRSDYFEVDPFGVVHAKASPADYVIIHLALNRPFARLVRARRILRVTIKSAIDALLFRLVEAAERSDEIIEIAELLKEAVNTLDELFDEDVHLC